MHTREPDAQHNLLARHITTLLGIETLARATVVLAVESNLGLEAHHILHAMRQRRIPHIALHEGAQEGPGLLTTNSTKEMMCVATQELLDTHRLVLSQNMVCLSTSPRDVLETLLKQMRTYTVIVEPARTAFLKPRRTFSGKIGGHQDDVCVAFQLAILASRIFTRSDKYSRFM